MQNLNGLGSRYTIIEEQKVCLNCFQSQWWRGIHEES